MELVSKGRRVDPESVTASESRSSDAVLLFEHQ